MKRSRRQPTMAKLYRDMGLEPLESLIPKPCKIINGKIKYVRGSATKNRRIGRKLLNKHGWVL